MASRELYILGGCSQQVHIPARSFCQTTSGRRLLEGLTMGHAGFTDSWYAQKIDQSMSGFEHASEDSRIIANAILTGFAMLAQSIDNSIGHTAEESDSNALIALKDIALEMSNIADRISGES
jgi:hypothetical protein